MMPGTEPGFCDPGGPGPAGFIRRTGIALCTGVPLHGQRANIGPSPETISTAAVARRWVAVAPACRSVAAEPAYWSAAAVLARCR